MLTIVCARSSRLSNTATCSTNGGRTPLRGGITGGSITFSFIPFLPLLNPSHNLTLHIRYILAIRCNSGIP